MPAITHQTDLYQVLEAMVYPMTADGVGVTPVYGTGVPVVGIKTVGGPVGAFASKESRGGGQLRSRRSKATGWTAPITFASLNMDAYAVMFGMSVVDSGTTPNRLAVLRYIDSGATLPYFGFQARTDGTDVIGYDWLKKFYKCQVDAASLALPEEDYSVFSVGLTLSRRAADNYDFDEALRESGVAVALSTTWA